MVGAWSSRQIERRYPGCGGEEAIRSVGNRVLLDAELDGLANDLPRPSASFYRRAISTLTTSALWPWLRGRSYSSAVVHRGMAV